MKPFLHTHRLLRRPWALLWLTMVFGLLLIWPVQRSLDLRLDFASQAPATSLVRSAKGMRPLCFGFNGLLGDIYWTRAVQYFGRARLAGKPMPHLGSLLSVATEFDPHLLIAYRFGAIFLAERSPEGAGDPQAALALLRKGIVANPSYWRLWEDLGFVYYWDLRDYPTAARIFRQGSQQPGAMTWMKVLAASVASRGGELETSQMLWERILRHSDNDQIRASAREHLIAVEAAMTIRRLDGLIEEFKRGTGHAPASFSELVTAGYLRKTPLDPAGMPFVITKGGNAGLNRRSKIDLRLATAGK